MIAKPCQRSTSIVVGRTFRRSAIRLVVVAILSNFLPGCSNADLSVRCAAALGASAHQTKIEASVAGSRVTIAGTELTLDAKIENETHQGSSWVIGIAVITSGAGSTFSAGSVGV